MTLLLTAILALTLAPGGGERMYVQNNWQFITLDPSTGQVLETKPLRPLINNRGLVYDDGSLYFLDQNAVITRDRLYRLDPATGRARMVGNTGYSIGQPGGFAKDPTTGQFFVTFADAIFKMDKLTGSIEFVARMQTGNPAIPITTLAIDSHGIAYSVADPSATIPRNRLFRVDLESGELTNLGHLDTGLGLFRTIAFDGSDQLWGLFTPFSSPSTHTLYKIDITTLTVTRPFPLPQGAMGIAFGPAPRVWSYCTGKVHSGGCAPRIGWTGHPSATAHFGFEVWCTDVRNQSLGMLVLGLGGRAALPFQGGTLCLAASYVTLPPVHSGGSPASAAIDCTGKWKVDLNTFLYHHLPLPTGTVIDCQWWGRDLIPPGAAQLSDALELILM